MHAAGRSKAPKDVTTNFPQTRDSLPADATNVTKPTVLPLRGTKSARHDDVGMPARQKKETGEALPDIAQYARENMPKKKGLRFASIPP